MSLKFGVCPLVVAWLCLSVIAAAGEDRAAQVNEPSILAQGPIELSPTANPKPVQEVIRNAKALAAVLHKENAEEAQKIVCKALKLKSIDFDKQMLLVVSYGPVHGGLQRLNVAKLTVGDKTLKVDWDVALRSASVNDPLTHPARVVLLDKFDGKVEFARPDLQRR